MADSYNLNCSYMPNPVLISQNDVSSFLVELIVFPTSFIFLQDCIELIGIYVQQTKNQILCIQSFAYGITLLVIIKLTKFSVAVQFRCGAVN